MAKKKSILVTGVTSGIGKAICERLLKEEYQIVGLGRDFHKMGDLVGSITPVQLDLVDLQALPARLTELARTHSNLDAVVLNAGRGELGHLEQFSYPQIRQLIDLNVTAQIYLARAFLPGLKRRGGGDILLMGSEAALQGRRQGTIYCASKFALRGFAQALREECAKSGVRVTLINPGVVDTPFFDDLPIRPGAAEDQHLRAEDVAEMVATVLQQRPGMVMDEINLSPLKRVVEQKKG